MSNPTKAAALDKYFQETRTWETDRLKQKDRSEKTAWIVAFSATVIALMSVVAVTALVPLKTVEPFVIRVDNSTGIVDVVATLKDGKTNYDEAVNKFFTQWYVRYREGYSKDLVEEFYESVGIMSVGLEQQKYYDWVNPKNPQSPINVYGPYAKVRIQIKSTSFIKPDIALVRYVKTVERGLDKSEVTHWATTIGFKYAGSPMKEKDRGINPLGFQVVDYRNDPDALSPDGTAPARQEPAPVAALAQTVTVFPALEPVAANKSPRSR